MDLSESTLEERRLGVEYVDVGDFALDCGQTLKSAVAAYRTFGDPKLAATKCIYICHSLSADCHVVAQDGHRGEGWWERFVGHRSPVDLDRAFVVCSNFLGGCFGTTGPTSTDPATGAPYGADFPFVTMSDIVRFKRRTLECLGIARLHAIIGGSFGGAQTLQFVRDNPGFADSAVVLAASARTSASARGINALARWAIESDPRFQGGRYTSSDPPAEGLAIARAILEHSFVERQAWDRRFSGARLRNRNELQTDIGDYLVAKGRTFAGAYDANTFHRVMHALDTYDLGNESAIAAAFSGAVERMLVVAVSTDNYFPQSDFGSMISAFTAAGVDVAYESVSSPIGHDAFFKDVEQFGPILAGFLSL